MQAEGVALNMPLSVALVVIGYPMVVIGYPIYQKPLRWDRKLGVRVREAFQRCKVYDS